MSDCKLNRSPLSEQIANQIEQHIRTKLWPLGFKLPSETELMKDFDVSRNTLREAIRSLVHAGMLDVRPGNGTYVLRDSRLDGVLQQRMQIADITEILETRKVFEKELVRMAAMRRDDDELTALYEMLEKRNDITREDAVEMDLQFHLKIAEMSGNRLLYDIYKTSLCEFIRLVANKYYIAFKSDRQNDLHNAIYAAIVARDPDLSERCILKMLEFDAYTLQGK